MADKLRIKYTQSQLYTVVRVFVDVIRNKIESENKGCPGAATGRVEEVIESLFEFLKRISKAARSDLYAPGALEAMSLVKLLRTYTHDFLYREAATFDTVGMHEAIKAFCKEALNRKGYE